MQIEQLRHDIIFKNRNKTLKLYDQILVVKEITIQLDAYLIIQIQRKSEIDCKRYE